MVLHSVGDWIKKKLQKYVPEEERMQSALSYGVDMALYTLFSTIGLLLIAAVLNSFITGLILIAVFYLNQTIGGGYHANSYLKCFLCMSMILLSGIAFGKLNLPNFILYILGLASGTALWIKPVVLHPNRAHLKNRLPYFIKRSRCIIAMEMMLGAILIIVGFRYAGVYVIAMFFSAVSRIVTKNSCAGQNGEEKLQKWE